MLKKLKNIFYLGSFFIFIVLITRFYFSDQNIRETNKSRSFYSVELQLERIHINNLEKLNDYDNYTNKNPNSILLEVKDTVLFGATPGESTLEGLLFSSASQPDQLTFSLQAV